MYQMNLSIDQLLHARAVHGAILSGLPMPEVRGGR